MKKIFTALFTALCALTVAQAETYSFSASDAIINEGQSTDRSYRNYNGFTYQGVGFTFSAGSNSEGVTYNRGGADFRMLAGNKLTIKSEANIQSVVLSITDAGLKQWAGVTASEGTVTADVAAKTVTWTGDATQVVLTVGDTSVNGTAGEEAPGQLYWDRATVTRSEIATLAALPVFSVPGGTYDEVINLTLTAADGAKIYYTTNGDLPTEESNLYTEPIKLNANRTIIAIAVEEGKTNSSAVVGKYNILYSKKVATIAEFVKDNPDAQVARIDTSYTFTGDCTVTYQNGRYLFVQDATGGLMIFGNTDHTYQVGDVITGFKGTFNGYYGTPQLIPTTNTFADATGHTDLTYPTGTQESITMDNLSRVYVFHEMNFYKDPENETDTYGYADFADLTQVKVINTFSNDACTDKMVLPAMGKYNITAIISQYTEDTFHEMRIAPIAFGDPTPEPASVAAIDAALSGVYGTQGEIVAPEGAKAYDLNGRPMPMTGLQPGVYVVVCGGNAFRVAVK